MNSEVFLYVPELFDPSLFPELAGLHEETYWLLHKIIALQIFYRHQTTQWVNISQQTIRQFIHPSQANIVRFTLLAHRIIECDGQWYKGCKSLGYRLAEPYRGEVKRVKISKPSLIAKILRHRIRREDKPIPESMLESVHRHLLACLRRVRIDTTRAYQIVDAMPEEISNLIPCTCPAALSSPSCTKPKSRKLGPRGRCKMVNTYRKAINRIAIEQISHGEFDYAVCKQGRVHTPITRLFTAARTCLSIDGKPLVSIDIVNSQLIFFALLFLESQYNRQAGDMDGKDMCEQGNDLSCSAFSSPSCTTEEADSRRFVALVMGGRIYNYLMGNYQKLAGVITTRKKFKNLFFQQVLYGDNSMYYASQLPLPVLFQHRFPSIWEFILRQKQWNGVGPAGEAFKKLAVRMQQRESRYMIGQVCSRLMKYHPEIPILTIHDSILTNPEYVPTVRRIMTEEFARLGVQPALRVE